MFKFEFVFFVFGSRFVLYVLVMMFKSRIVDRKSVVRERVFNWV